MDPRMTGRNSQWTFLSNHSHVLVCIATNPSITMRELAGQVGITERAVQRIVSDLRSAGYLSYRRQGRRNLYSLHTGLPMRHPVESDCLISDLLEAIIRCRQVDP